jgi:hypothetical protein
MGGLDEIPSQLSSQSPHKKDTDGLSVLLIDYSTLSSINCNLNTITFSTLFFPPSLGLQLKMFWRLHEE